MMRYRDTGALHPDFHGTMNATMEYLGSTYGREALRAVFAATAQNVYSSIYEKIRRGDLSELIEHWRYYLDRENADYTLDVDDSGVTLTVRD